MVILIIIKVILLMMMMTIWTIIVMVNSMIVTIEMVMIDLVNQLVKRARHVETSTYRSILFLTARRLPASI